MKTKTGVCGVSPLLARAIESWEISVMLVLPMAVTVYGAGLAVFVLVVMS